MTGLPPLTARVRGGGGSIIFHTEHPSWLAVLNMQSDLSQRRLTTKRTCTVVAFNHLRHLVMCFAGTLSH
jgi:hypothetical protein